ncbi:MULTISPECIES: patatin-like phospholipase family protein [unclassified Sutcliffiella]|uniref:patatin-like phospholipase family protein n=1 Tax=unclassified Sutcliffiella TaxID=2837532 RepID=UPI0030CDCF23
MGDKQNIGLALSGGGFRAAFFHIGVLASLADVGVLKNVKVLSTVSGGTIIGVLYYLKLKSKIKDLETKSTGDEINQFYRDIIEEVKGEFYEFVKLNIRTMSFLNPLKNSKIFLSELLKVDDYTRSKHIGELIEKHLYKKYRVDAKKPLLMSDLHSVENGLPKLIINTTNYNSGGSWLFETDKMRQLQSNARSTKNISFSTINYKKGEKEVCLSDAVAASACVPGLFRPIKLRGMFNSGLNLNLIDGGIFDNQGIESLLPENCTHFIVSDGSKQLNNQYRVKSTLEIFGRTNDMLMSRVREQQINNLLDRFGQEKVAFIHLLYGTNGVKWTEDEGSMFLEQKTDNIEKEVIPNNHLNLLSKIRTDLDSFTEIEAYSLMYSGFKISNTEIEDRFGLESTNNINFAKNAEGFFGKSVVDEKFKDHIEISQKRFLKWYYHILLKIKKYPKVNKKESTLDRFRNRIFNFICKPKNLIIPSLITLYLIFGLDTFISLFGLHTSPSIHISFVKLLWLLAVTIIFLPVVLIVISTLVFISLNTLDKLFLHLGKIKNN